MDEVLPGAGTVDSDAAVVVLEEGSRDAAVVALEADTPVLDGDRVEDIQDVAGLEEGIQHSPVSSEGAVGSY